MLIYLLSPVITGDRPYWHILLAYFFILWSHDTFAYLTGILLGKHKLFEKVSPKKTWEGTIGGTLFGLVAAYILSLYLPRTQYLAMAGSRYYHFCDRHPG